MTAQLHEQLILDGKRTSMISCPPLPLHDPRLVPREDGAPSSDLEALTRSTACWRGYVATWEVRDNRLYLCAIVGSYALHADQPVFADWVSDILRVPDGELLRYVHMGFESIYEREIELVVSEGVVVECSVVNQSDRQADH